MKDHNLTRITNIITLLNDYSYTLLNELGWMSEGRLSSHTDKLKAIEADLVYELKVLIAQIERSNNHP